MVAYLAKLEQDGKNTRRARSFANSAINPTLGAIRLRDLDRETLSQWLADLAASPRQTRTGGLLAAPKSAEEIRRRRASANRTWGVLRAALNLALDDGRIHSDAAWKRVKMFKNAASARLRWLSGQEIRRFVDACEEPFRTLALAALYSGCRLGELRQLVVADFDARSETLCVRVSKSGKSRHVTLTKEAATFFARIAAGRGGEELLLQRADGEGWRDGEQRRRMLDACQRAGIAPAGFHSLRHTFASLALQDGVPMLMVAHNLGHGDTRMVEAHYGHIDPDNLRQTIRERTKPLGFDSDGSNIVTLRR